MPQPRPKRQPIVGVILALVLVLGPKTAPAQADPEAERQAEDEARAGYPFYVVPDEFRDQRREVPDYDGRGTEPMSGTDALVWVPRYLLMPVQFAMEYAVRKPIGKAVTKAEQEELPARVIDAFRFGERQQVLIAPTFSFDFGLRANIGLMVRWKEVGHPDNSFNADFAFGGVDYVSGGIGDSYSPSNKKWAVSLNTSASRRADGLFFGLNETISEDNESRFNWVGSTTKFGFDVDPWRRTHISLSTGYRYVTFGDNVSGTSIPDLVEEGNIPELPPGYEDGYSIVFQSTVVSFDTRLRRPSPVSGFVARVNADFALDVRDPTALSWVVYGAAAGAFWDVSKSHHVISAGAGVAFSDAFAGEVPFTEVPVISGNGPMSGFVGRYLIGDSAFAASVNYTWPIWLFLDGKIHVATGNVFAGHLSAFELSKLRLSFSGGIAAVGTGDHFFEILAGFGTTAFEDGAKIESVRILIGASRDF